MKIYRFDAAVGRQISQFDSNFIMSPIVRSSSVQVGCMHIPAGGLVGYHQASVPQLFLVVAGEGWVRGEETAHTAISVGGAAFWQGGEWHEAGSDTGMMVIVIESEDVDPRQLMSEASS